LDNRFTKEHLTTGEAASLCSVTPDTVLKWIMAGKIPANRTPGGHHRIPYSALMSIIKGKPEKVNESSGKRLFEYCWEYYSKTGATREGCRKCIVYRSGTRRCYEISRIPSVAGHTRLFCEKSCDECDYYQLVNGQRPNVLVVTDNDKLMSSLQDKKQSNDYNQQFTDCEYRCSMVIEQFRPDYVIVDCSMGVERSREFATFLSEDPRIPFVKIILAGDKRKIPKECDKLVFAYISSPFGGEMIMKLIGCQSAGTD
jgi:excisionase family DNA binding protein